MIPEKEFNNLQINDVIYFYDNSNNIIRGLKITGITHIPMSNFIDKSYKIIEIMGDFNIKYEININSNVFLTEKECLQYYINNNDYRKELKYRYGAKYPEYFI